MISLRRWQTWALSFLFWTGYAVLDSVGSYALLAASSGKPVLRDVFLWNFAEAYIWVLLTPFIYVVALKFGLTNYSWKTSLPVHILAAILFTTFGAWLLILFNTSMGWAQTTIPFRLRLLGLTLQDLPRYFVTVGVAHVVSYYANLRQREAEATRLETQLAQAQLEILRGQMEPHFLFNALNSIATLTRTDPASAEQMTLQLSALLRVSLENVSAQIVPLKQELDFLNNYLRIQQTRFRDRLTIRMNVDSGLLTFRVPSLILQPLVENAIRHGIAKSAAPGCVDIQVARENGSIKIEIADNGIGIADRPAAPDQGFGLRNTRARLQQLYGDRHDLRLEGNPGGGCRVTLSLPIQEPLLVAS